MASAAADDNPRQNRVGHHLLVVLLVLLHPVHIFGVERLGYLGMSSLSCCHMHVVFVVKIVLSCCDCHA